MSRIDVGPVSVTPEAWEVTYDGVPSWRHYRSREEAVDAAFSRYAWPGGYDLVYLPVEDGCAVLCADCAKREYVEDGTAFESAILSEPLAKGEWCEGHNGWITEPYCSECGTDESDLKHGRRLWVSDNGNKAYCERCIATAYVDGLSGVGRLAADRPYWHTYHIPMWGGDVRQYQTTVYEDGYAVGTFHP